ncbi:hypothetical protein LguiB_018472 [Lonicera macranthoides]
MYFYRLPSNSSLFVSTPKPQGCGLEKVSNLFEPNFLAWNARLIHQLFSSADASIIESIPIAISNGRDIWVWHFPKSGKFSVKSAYAEALKSVSSEALIKPSVVILFSFEIIVEVHLES